MKTIATIDLDNGEGRGELFWMDGSIWCNPPSGLEFDTQTTCKKSEAKQTIAVVWGAPVWDLEWN